MSFFAGLAQGIQAGVPLGDAIVESQRRKKYQSALEQYGSAAVGGDMGAIGQLAKYNPEGALAIGQGALAMQSQQRQQQAEALGAGMAFFGDVNDPQTFEARKKQWASSPYASAYDFSQVSFDMLPALRNQAVGYINSQLLPYEKEKAKLAAQAARQTVTQGDVALRQAGAGMIGQARGARPDIGDRAGYAFNYLKRKGMPDHVAAAVVGNLIQESGPSIDPTAVGDGGAAYGAGQWNGPRKRALEEFAASRGADPSNFDVQLEFMLYEMDNDEKAAGDALRGAKTVEEATRIASERYWRPGDPRMGNRQRYAAEAMRRYGGRDVASEGARDAVASVYPGMADYMPQGPISAEQGAMLQQPNTTPEKLQERRQMLAAAGVPEDSEAGRQYLLTGKLPSGESISVGSDGSVQIVKGDAGFGTATTNKIDQKVVEISDQLAQARDVISGFDPGLQETLPRLENSYFELKDRFGLATPDERQRLERFAEHRSRAAAQLNATIKAMAGAAVSESEAARLYAEIPNAGTGVFDGDSPTVFMKKAEEVMRRLDSAAQRYQYWRQQGGQGNPWDASTLYGGAQPQARPQPAQQTGPSPMATPQPQAAGPERTGQSPRLSDMGYQDQQIEGVTVTAQEQYEFDRLVNSGMSEMEAFQRVHEMFNGAQ